MQRTTIVKLYICMNTQTLPQKKKKKKICPKPKFFFTPPSNKKVGPWTHPFSLYTAPLHKRNNMTRTELHTARRLHYPTFAAFLFCFIFLNSQICVGCLKKLLKTQRSSPGSKIFFCMFAQLLLKFQPNLFLFFTLYEPKQT